MNPSRVYAKELSECRNQQASSASSTSSSDSSHSENESSRSTSSRYASIENETNQTTPRALRGSSDRNKHTIEDEGERKRDPRLWIYRYKSPPRPVPPQTKPTATSSPSFTVPVYKEGTIVRIIGKIFINTSRGNERQIEASSIECLYEPSYIIGRRIYKEKGNKYAEWHHTVNCRKKRLEYKDREKVRELIGFTDGNTGYANQSNSQSMSQDVTMQDDSMVSSPQKSHMAHRGCMFI